MNRNVLSRRALVGVAVAALALAGCGGGDDDSDTGTDTGTDASAGATDYSNLSGELKATGASFPDAYYQEVITEFKGVASKLTVTYNATGSGQGKKDFGANLNDFAGSDSTVKDTDGVAAGSYLYVPTVAAPITVSFNVSGVDKLQLSADTLAKIFQTDIKKWNDAAIAADNPGVTLPDKNITVAHRADGSGTTNNFTKYLVAAAPETWKLKSGDTVDWPASTQGAQKNSGVAQLIKSTDGAIGYVDFSDAKASGLKFAAIKNKDGQFVEASLDGATAALNGATIKDDLTYDPLNAAGATTYPITAPTYILVRPSYPDAAKKDAVKGFVTYILTEGQALAPEVDFAPLPDGLKTKALAQLDKIQ
ncbi:phosphate ABC transporter substrate-binding protein PstS [Phytohabitans sp. ZYX-F-186]|uniref:Phosphate-binding protein n=1 Tax=Phytohabitans maris TaxID=3071409 RepID=A0ABU0ZI43_9ACTN|nr:phosphate ABC transporter substrate-binding protein PstS [Phytohabitans sp. ZYX-F-186]MDQ7906670.1 phosphate ABC transporter substrate-binding protein PstS [Phytohabitans sp. ZYX-F-186]